MNSTKIVTFDYLKNNKIAYVKVSDLFRQKLKNKLLHRYGSLSKYSKEKLNIPHATLTHEFRVNKYFKFDRGISYY